MHASSDGSAENAGDMSSLQSCFLGNRFWQAFYNAKQGDLEQHDMRSLAWNTTLNTTCLKPTMGNQSSEPVLDYVDPVHVARDLEIGAVGMQGRRTTMEDYHVAVVLPSRPDHVLVGVFDGHGGKAMAEYVQQNLVRVLESTDTWVEGLSIVDALTDAFFQLDSEACESMLSMSSPGTTAIVAIVTPDQIVCANVGDSRACLLTKGGDIVPLSTDHKPNLDRERARIEAAGGCVIQNRVDGKLALSRALGDYEYKADPTLYPTQQKVSPEPDITIWPREDAAVLLLASDGVWDVFTNEEAMDTIRLLIVDEGESNAQLVAEEVVHLSIVERTSNDNATALIVRFPNTLLAASENGQGVLGRRTLRDAVQAGAVQAGAAQADVLLDR